MRRNFLIFRRHDFQRSKLSKQVFLHDFRDCRPGGRDRVRVNDVTTWLCVGSTLPYYTLNAFMSKVRVKHVAQWCACHEQIHQTCIDLGCGRRFIARRFDRFAILQWPRRRRRIRRRRRMHFYTFAKHTKHHPHAENPSRSNFVL